MLNSSSFANDKNNGSKENIKTILIKVTDTSGEELAGAKVMIVETGKEFITDFNGTIQIQSKANENYTIKITSLGYQEKTIKSAELGTLNDLSLSSLN